MKFFTTTLLIGALSSLAVAVPQRPQGQQGQVRGPPTTTTTTTTKATTTTTKAGTTTTTKAATTTSAVATTTTTTATTTTGRPICLQSAAATSLVTGFASLLTAYTNETAEALLASDFTDTSQSINFLSGKSLSAVSFPTKLSFELGQGSLPPIGLTVLEIDAITCNTIVFRWEASISSTAPYPVRGINILTASNLNNTQQGWQIKTVYAEFNSAVWFIDLGGACAFPGAPAVTPTA